MHSGLMACRVGVRVCLFARRGWRFGRGGAVLEMALVLPILLMLAFGTADYGYFFFVKHTVTGAAQVGARAAIPASATNANVTAAVANAMSAAGFQSASYTITLSPSDISTAADGSSIQVTVTCSWGTVGLHALPSAMGGISNSKNVIGVATMRKEAS
jgi:Flp pilus assembly protein TadG